MEHRTFPSPSPGTATVSPGRPAPEPARAAPRTPPRTLRARRRRPAVLAMAVAMVAAGGLGGAVLYNSTGQRTAVLALARDVPMGQAITAEDLVVARIASDPVLHPLGAAERTRAIGLFATSDLHRGALLVKADVTSELLVEPGQTVVGVATKRTQLPATRLQPGSRVLIVSTPDSGQGSTVRTPETIAVRVVAVGKADTDGSQVIDVALAPADGPRLAAWVATGRLQIILAPRAPGAAAPAASSSSPPSSSPSPSGSGT
ncbi:SAF domain-containing protein [Kitasatospora sp. NPDC002040]|uniref:SAF domain-containing protein n=1 Tax=Kitasatospora sp. NPDC002040 TaxID=3154661 RepID=UPI0033205A85